MELKWILLQPDICSRHSGHSGLGKSTLLNTLFKSQVSRRSAGWSRDEKIPKTVEIKAVSHGRLKKQPLTCFIKWHIYSIFYTYHWQ